MQTHDDDEAARAPGVTIHHYEVPIVYDLLPSTGRHVNDQQNMFSPSESADKPLARLAVVVMASRAVGCCCRYAAFFFNRGRRDLIDMSKPEEDFSLYEEWRETE